MKVQAIGVNCRKGTSEKNGRPYEIAEITYCVPDESGQKKSDSGAVVWVYTGYGNRIRTLPVNPSNIHAFRDVKFPAEIDLLIEPQPDKPSHNWVVGLK